ncbi:MAG: DNA repair protein RadA [Actinobacteria bacterium]|nr:DNA repair protein RadA [Actinomycetota bacterium]
MAKLRTLNACRECGQQIARWAGRCPGCGAWGTIEERVAAGASGSPMEPVALGQIAAEDIRVGSGLEGVDRVLGGGLVPASVVLLGGEPGIGKSTLLLHLVANLCGAGHPCLLASGEESHAQVGARARRLGLDGGAIRFVPGRDLAQVLGAARADRPFLLAVDSVQSIRDPEGTQAPGGPSQVRLCADALVGLAKSEGIAVLLTGHVTKDGDLAGPRTLEHAVDVVLSFEGDPRSGLRVLSGGKNRFGAEGEAAWFEMGARGLREIDPTRLLVSGERHPGAATALPRSGRRALAVEVQALVGAAEGPARRTATGLDPRRFSLVAAVLDRAAGFGFARTELYGASSGGILVDDPACDLAVAAALASAATGVAPPPDSAFVGEMALTGQVRPVASMSQRMAAARAAACSTVFAPEGATGPSDLRVVPVRHVIQAVGWALKGKASRGVAQRHRASGLGESSE